MTALGAGAGVAAMTLRAELACGEAPLSLPVIAPERIPDFQREWHRRPELRALIRAAGALDEAEVAHSAPVRALWELAHSDAWRADERKAEADLAALFDQHVAGDLIPDDELPGVPRLLGDVCRVCGCSDEDSCVPQCGWAGPGICTNCDAGEVRPRAPGIATPEQAWAIREAAEEEFLRQQTCEDGWMRILASPEYRVST